MTQPLVRSEREPRLTMDEALDALVTYALAGEEPWASAAQLSLDLTRYEGSDPRLLLLVLERARDAHWTQQPARLRPR